MQFWMNKKCAQIHPTHPVPKLACLRQHSTRNFGAWQLWLCIRFRWFGFNLVHKHRTAVFFWGKSVREPDLQTSSIFQLFVKADGTTPELLPFMEQVFEMLTGVEAYCRWGLSSAHFPGASIKILGIQEFVLLTGRLQRQAYEASKCLKEVKGSIFLGWTLFFLWHLVFSAASLDRHILTNTTDADDDQQHMC